MHEHRGLTTRARIAGALVAAAAMALVFVPTAAHADHGGNNVTTCTTTNSTCVVISANDASTCSKINVGIDAWQCTPVLVASAASAQTPADVGGRVDWSGVATCQYRKKGDGAKAGWTAWKNCSPSSKSGSASRSWGLLQSPRGGSIHMQWDPIVNKDTWGLHDCVQIHTSVRATGSGKTQVLGTTIESSPSRSTRMPSSGTNTHTICE